MKNRTYNSYPKPDKPVLQQKIIEIIDDSSGGIKFIDLVSRLISLKKFKEFSDNERFLHDVEWYCRNTKDIRTLDYTMRTLNRNKMFIYTP
jgi:hypothetical protein